MAKSRRKKSPEELLGITKKRPRKISVKISRKYDLDLANAFHEAAQMLDMAKAKIKKAPKARGTILKKIAKIKPPRKPRYNDKKPQGKKWIRHDIERPGRYRKLMEVYGWALPGESIPADIKNAGCLNPEETYKILFNQKVKDARLFQKQSCLARTFKKLPDSRRKGSRRYGAEEVFQLRFKPNAGSPHELFSYINKRVGIQSKASVQGDSLLIENVPSSQRMEILTAAKDYDVIHRHKASLGNPLHAIYRAAASR
jgi:hypothetical protein